MDRGHQASRGAECDARMQVGVHPCFSYSLADWHHVIDPTCLHCCSGFSPVAESGACSPLTGFSLLGLLLSWSAGSRARGLQ